jgi:hypothetical protein
MKSQLVIGHCFYSPNKSPQREEEGKIKSPFGNIPVIFWMSHQFLFQYRPLRMRKMPNPWREGLFRAT